MKACTIQDCLLPKMLLDPSMAESIQRIQGWIAQTYSESFIELVAHDHLETAIAIRNLKNGSVTVTPVFSKNTNQTEDSLHRTKQRIGGGSQWNHVNLFAELEFFALGTAITMFMLFRRGLISSQHRIILRSTDLADFSMRLELPNFVKNKTI